MYARRGTHSNGLHRWGWSLMGSACFSWAVGDAAWTYYETVLKVRLLSPAWPDAGYLMTYPLVIAGLFSLSGKRHPAGRARFVLDCLIAATSAGVLSWTWSLSISGPWRTARSWPGSSTWRTPPGTLRAWFVAMGPGPQ